MVEWMFTLRVLSYGWSKSSCVNTDKKYLKYLNVYT